MENTKKFTEATGVDVRVDVASWEDLRPQTATAANVGSGPRHRAGVVDDPQQFADKVVDLTELATYLGRSTAAGRPRRAVRRQGRSLDRDGDRRSGGR